MVVGSPLVIALSVDAPPTAQAIRKGGMELVLREEAGRSRRVVPRRRRDATTLGIGPRLIAGQSAADKASLGIVLVLVSGGSVVSGGATVVVAGGVLVAGSKTTAGVTRMGIEAALVNGGRRDSGGALALATGSTLAAGGFRGRTAAGVAHMGIDAALASGGAKFPDGVAGMGRGSALAIGKFIQPSRLAPQVFQDRLFHDPVRHGRLMRGATW